MPLLKSINQRQVWADSIWSARNQIREVSSYIGDSNLKKGEKL